jgi:hypothetical protein
MLGSFYLLTNLTVLCNEKNIDLCLILATGVALNTCFTSHTQRSRRPTNATRIVPPSTLGMETCLYDEYIVAKVQVLLMTIDDVKAKKNQHFVVVFSSETTKKLRKHMFVTNRNALFDQIDVFRSENHSIDSRAVGLEGYHRLVSKMCECVCA